MRKVRAKALKRAATFLGDRYAVSRGRKAKRTYKAKRQGRAHNTNRTDVDLRGW